MSITMTRCSIVLFVSFVAAPYGNADETAEHYLLAALACDRMLPDYVENATTDHPTLGFVNPVAAEHTLFLKQSYIRHALSHFEEATGAKDCIWERYVGFSWSEGYLNDRLHQLARLALFRARTCYDTGRWVDGNRDVERVRIMARHMTHQARPVEHQCFMVENMAVLTAAAYLFRFPKTDLADLSERHNRIGVFSPMRGMLSRESLRIRDLSIAVERGGIAPADALSISGYGDDLDRAPDISVDTTSHDLKGLAAFLDEVSRHMEMRNQDECEKILRALTRRFRDSNQLIARLDDYASNEFRENAQGVCRNTILTSLLERLLNDNADFTTIPDPYSSESLQLKSAGTGFVLVSILSHHGRLRFDFGAAGKK